MTDYVTFDGAIVPMPWGDKVYTVLRLPDPILEALGNPRRVEGEIAEHPVNLALSRAPVIEGVFLWNGRSLLDRIGIEPGDPVEVRLRPADDAAVELPDDLGAALRAHGATDAWEALTPGKQRGEIYQLSTAKRAETRARRIAALVARLGA